jgi:hypothetical protein
MYFLSPIFVTVKPFLRNQKLFIIPAYQVVDHNYLSCPASKSFLSSTRPLPTHVSLVCIPHIRGADRLSLLASNVIQVMRRLEEINLRVKTNDTALDEIVIDFRRSGFQADAFFPEAALKMFTQTTQLTRFEIFPWEYNRFVCCPIYLLSINRTLKRLALEDIQCGEAASPALVDSFHPSRAKRVFPIGRDK